MDGFAERFYALDNGYRNLKLENVVIDKRNSGVTLNFLGIPEYLDAIGADGREKIGADATRLLATAFKVETNFKKAYADEKNIASRLFDFLNAEYPSSAVHISGGGLEVSVDRDARVISVRAGVDGYMKGYADSIGLDAKLAEFIEANYFETARVEFYISETAENEYKIRETAPLLVKRDMIYITNAEKVYGKTILSYPKTIKSISAEAESVVLCGRIGRLDKRVSKSSNPYYVFELNDTTGSITAKLFPRKRRDYGGQNSQFSGDAALETAAASRGSKPEKSGTEALDALRDNEEVVVGGSVRHDIYGGDLVIIVNDINRCRIDYSGLGGADEYNKAGDEYVCVRPKKYEEPVQQDFLSPHGGIPFFLEGRTFTVFDCETTGLDRANDGIIEIGAVKIENGAITETFETLVNPGREVGGDITALTGITNDELKTAPKIETVFGDFYKFIGETPIVAHNIEFDIEFIRRAAKRMNYYVGNEMYDTMTIARKHFSVQNYKLGTLCEFFDIKLKDAHRALNDALATAKLFIILAAKL
ncbi:MAG: 3'-5' exoribonuclease [Clostridiales bacterium]|jgi:DNA polymerase III epsilon subunit family exonuclease|nr:3'-5' exoribonuclease [Clostridiales bacterium]